MNKFILTIALVSIFSSPVINATIIDDFSKGFILVEADNPGVYVTAENAFGGGRTISITKKGDGARATVLPFKTGYYTLNLDAKSSATSTISWSDTSGVDLFNNQNNAFALDIYKIDQGNVNFILTVTDKTNNTDSYPLFDATAGVRNIPFSLFSAVNLHQVTEISLQIAAGLESDLIINSLATSKLLQSQVSSVPVPPALVFFSSGIALLALSRRTKSA